MKTIIAVTIIFLIAFAASSDGCQETKEKPNLFLTEVQHNNSYYLFRQFSDKESRERYDTICIMCEPETLLNRSELKLEDYRSVWKQEYDSTQDMFTGTVLHLEKINKDCIKCPQGKKRYMKTFFGYR